MERRKIRNKIQVIKATKFPDVLVVTPLLERHRISKNTKKSIHRNHLKYFWISSEGNNNIPTNYEQGIWWAQQNLGRKFPKYSIMIDNDIILARSMLDRLYDEFKDDSLISFDNVAFSYASFQFKGEVNAQFPADPFDIKRLMQANYISSNSMFKTDVIEKVGLVTDNKYKRLLDYAFLLKLAANGYVGIPEPRARFVAVSEPGSISAGNVDDYRLKYQRVHNDFIKPLLEKVLYVE